MSKKQTIPVKSLAKLLDADTAWMAGVLGRLHVVVDSQGRFHPRKMRKALDRLALAPTESAKIDAIARAQMGNSQESCRLWLIRQFEKKGFKLLHREEDRSARLTLQRPDGTNLWLMSFVSLRTKTNPGQIGFTTSPGRRGGYDWFAFVALPFGKIYLQSRRDMKARWIRCGKTGPVGRMSLTFSAGVDTDLFENRIADVLGGT